MRYITVPPHITLKNPRTKQPFEDKGSTKPFIDYAFEVWFNDPRASENGPAKLRRWMKMVDAFEKYCNPGDVVTLDDEDWTLLKTIIEAPKMSYPPLVAIQFDPFTVAVLEAPDTDPRKEPTTPEPPAN
jgi:hypothetical protein